MTPYRIAWITRRREGFARFPVGLYCYDPDAASSACAAGTSRTVTAAPYIADRSDTGLSPS
ncbi:hypothetical protein ABZ297_42985 [Nonomuraea sp. NPDC005983]|uniref:hypothetical protein n=1 Tax=Nonomuraea sp. NPDC005983 TaxID=3155595 RepID=UPI0033B6A3AC